MFEKVLITILLLIGVNLLHTTIKNYNKDEINKYKKMKQYRDLATGASYSVLGLLTVFNMISVKYLMFAIVGFTLWDMYLGNKIKLL